MAKINANYDKLAAGYLFPEIARRTQTFLEAHPGVSVMRLGIGDTTEPIVPAVLDGLHLGVDKLSLWRPTRDTAHPRALTPCVRPLRPNTAKQELRWMPPKFS